MLATACGSDVLWLFEEILGTKTHAGTPPKCPPYSERGFFKSEKANPLDGLKIGDKVLFRLHERHYLNGRLTLMAIPYADNPNKEVEFSTQFVPDVALSQLTRHSQVCGSLTTGHIFANCKN